MWLGYVNCTILGDQDYDELSAVPLYFPAGTQVGSTDCATISITNDDILESNESFSFSLSSSDPVNFDVSMGAALILEDTDCEFAGFAVMDLRVIPGNMTMCFEND